MNMHEVYRMSKEAELFLRQNRPEQAIPLLQDALSEPDIPTQRKIDIICNLGVAFYLRWCQRRDLQDLKSALQYYKKAIQVDPECTTAMVGLGNVYDDMGDSRQAEGWYRRTLAIDPRHTDAWSNLGMILHKRNDLEGAKECYERTVQIEPLHANAMNNLGEIYREQKDYDRAEGWYRKALAADPRQRQARENLQKVTQVKKGSFQPAPPTPRPEIVIGRDAPPTPSAIPRMEYMVEEVLDALRNGRLNFDQALALILTPEDKRGEVFPLVETLMQLGREYTEQVIGAIDRVMSSQRPRQREMFVYAVFGAYLEKPKRYFNTLKELAQNDHEWVKFAVSDCLLSGKLTYGISVPGSTEAALKIALGLLDSCDREVVRKVAENQWGLLIRHLDRSVLSERARLLYSQFETKLKDVWFW